MASSLQSLARRGLIKPPPFVVSNLHYEVTMGSQAYGVATDSSDCDLYGFAIPPKDVLFPHLAGVLRGFGDQGPVFEQYQQHHVADADAGKSYDFAIYNIAKYFQLCCDCNPNLIDSLFVPEECVKHATAIGQVVRERRRQFLSKRAWPRFKGYAYSQLHKIAIKTPEPDGKRAALVAEHGYDTKFAYHVVRLLGECEQILDEGDLDLRRDSERLKAIRRGEWAEADIQEHARLKLKRLEGLYETTGLPAKPDEAAIKRLLLDCLEEHYGDLGACVVREDRHVRALRAIAAVVAGLDWGAA